jgi:outer membrane protein TolC
VELHPALPAPSGYSSEYHPPPAPPSRPEQAAASRSAAEAEAADSASSDEEESTDAQRKSSAAAPQGSFWWSAFDDPALDAVIKEALQHNYLIRDLRNLIYENELDPAMPKGALWPLQIGVPATVQHVVASIPPGGGAPASALTFEEADVSLSASYQVDVWGQLDVTRRLFEDLVEEQRQNTEARAQNVAEQVAQLWFEILEKRALLALLERQVAYNQDLLEIVRARFEQHLVTRLAVLQQEQLLLATRAQAPLVTSQLALLNSNLTALLGRTPSPSVNLVPEDRRLPDLPPAPAVGTPAGLLRSSPELRVAQARVAEAEHQMSQNLASWLPKVEAFGNVGVQSYNFGQTFPLAGIGVRLTWPVFDGGQRITQAKQLELTIERRNWQYKLAFNNAIQRVQDALIQEQKQADQLDTLRAQVDLGRRVLQEARQLFEQGLSDYLPVLTALANQSNLERAALQAQRLLLSYRIQLYHALGGTWSAVATKRPAN